MNTQKLKYLLRSAANFGQKKECPYCFNTSFQKSDVKYLFTSLLKCDNCGLLHRHPKDKIEWSEKFYQSEYAIDVHMMTNMPTDEEIQKLKDSCFPNLRDFYPYLQPLIGDKAKVIDYGCSWGYNVFKLIQSGYNAEGYELSKPRAAFGKQKLEVKIHNDEKELSKEVDLVLSSHVIEHLPDIQHFINLSRTCLKQDGVFMAFCPNGNQEYRKREPDIWHVNWGSLHPNFLDIEFAKFAFKDNPYLILTDDWDFNFELIKNWDDKSQVVGSKLDGKELLIIAKPNQSI